MRKGRPYKTSITRKSIEERYESYNNEYIRAAKAEYAKQGIVLTDAEAMNAVMYDQGGRMTLREFNAAYHAVLNEQASRREAGDIKKTGNIIRSIVSDQRYPVSSAQARVVPIYLRKAQKLETEEIEEKYEKRIRQALYRNRQKPQEKQRTESEIERDYRQREKEELKSVRAKYRDIRKSDWRSQGVDMTLLSTRNKELKAAGITDSSERSRIISKEFFYVEDYD